MLQGTMPSSAIRVKLDKGREEKTHQRSNARSPVAEPDLDVVFSGNNKGLYMQSYMTVAKVTFEMEQIED
ncbi:MAG: hypothetical protein AAF693_18515 [Bacteroidota bacterium]